MYIISASVEAGLKELDGYVLERMTNRDGVLLNEWCIQPKHKFGLSGKPNAIISNTRNGIVIFGDLSPIPRGCCATAGHWLNWFLFDHSVRDLAQVFLTRTYRPSLARKTYEKLAKKLGIEPPIVPDWAFNCSVTESISVIESELKINMLKDTNWEEEMWVGYDLKQLISLVIIHRKFRELYLKEKTEYWNARLNTHD